MKIHVFEFCGCDVHKKFIEVAWFDISGQNFLHGQYKNTVEGNKLFWEECRRLGTKKVAMESTGIYWKAFYKSHPDNIETIVFNSASIKLKTRPKTDVRDAMWIARCLRAEFINPSNITTGETDEIKSLCRLRNRIVEEMTNYKNKIHSIIDKNQKDLKSFTSTMNTQIAMVVLTVLAVKGDFKDVNAIFKGRRQFNLVQRKKKEITLFLKPKLIDNDAFELDLAIRGLLERSQACSEVERKLMEYIQKPSIHKNIEQLNSIVGFSGISSLQLFIELGNVERFPTSKQIVAWTGLCPTVKSSGGKTTRGHITKRGNSHTRRLMFQVARSAANAKNSPFKDWYIQLKNRKNGKIALVALARKLLVIAYTLLKKGEFFMQKPVTTGIKIHSNAKKVIKAFSDMSLAPLLDILVSWIDKPKESRYSINTLFETMYKEIPISRKGF